MPNAVRCPLVIRPVNLPVPGLDDLQAEASAEGFQFIDTLIEQWSTGENRFNQPGEILLGILENDILIAIGGLNRDQFLNDPSIGRIRRVYVRRAWRSQGSGRALVTALLDHARQHFRSVRLRAVSPNAARLYERLGFLPIDDPNATHIHVFHA